MIYQLVRLEAHYHFQQELDPNRDNQVAAVTWMDRGSCGWLHPNQDTNANHMA